MNAFRRATEADIERITALQQAAYARNRAMLGVQPIPLQAEYQDILATMDVRIVERGGVLAAVLVVEPQSDHLLIWSIATDPSVQQAGLGRLLLQQAEDIARDAGLHLLRLYTGTKLTHLVAWYSRHGFVVDRIEERPDRSITHMSKVLE